MRARGIWVTVALAVLLPLGTFLWIGDRGLNTSDEGFLWYGVQATRAGEVPLRDFQAYDPGRYHWCAALAPLFGDGILGTRRAIAVFQGLGLLCALLVLRRAASAAPAQLFLGVLLVLWMFPRHKLFESSTGAIAAWFAVRLVEQPSTARHLATGVMVGLAGYLGRNLGLYCGLSTALLVLYLQWKLRAPGFARRAGAWALGVGLGYAPMLAMLGLVPGFARAFVDSLRMILEHGVNISKPWPWPWRVDTEGLRPVGVLREWMTAAAFLLPVLGLPALLLAALRTRAAELGARAACIAPAVVALPFLHHAMVLSRPGHLAQSILPLLLALFAVPVLFPERRRRAQLATFGGLALVSLGFTLTSNSEIPPALGGQPVVEQRVGAETLRLDPRQARVLVPLERVLASTVGDAPVFLAPGLPALYCVLGKRSPSWWVFLFWDATQAEQEALIRELREGGVEWALVAVAARAGLGGRFHETHPLVWQHLETEWRRVNASGLPPEHVLFRRR